MSKVAIKGADTGTGVFTIESPATNTDRTLTLPDEAGALATEAYVGTQALGVGQTWTDVSGSRSSGVTYTNTTGRPILVLVTLTLVGQSGTFKVDGATIQSYLNNDGSWAVRNQGSVIVPNGSTYVLTTTGAIAEWLELR